MRSVTIRQALQYVAEHPELTTDEVVALPVHELVCRTLFDIANNPMSSKRGSLARANVARGLIFNRLVGKRQAGSHPAVPQKTQITFKDLSGQVEA